MTEAQREAVPGENTTRIIDRRVLDRAQYNTIQHSTVLQSVVLLPQAGAGRAAALHSRWPRRGAAAGVPTAQQGRGIGGWPRCR